jgi:hypothetical protein
MGVVHGGGQKRSKKRVFSSFFGHFSCFFVIFVNFHDLVGGGGIY